jgi:CubicO group peptidase (beta-lactamase class C family)
MQVGGRVLELATGEDFAGLFARRVAQPLGLESMVFGSLGSGEHPLVYGGARSTMRDYMTFLRMLLNDGVHDGKAFLAPDSVRELLTDRTGSVPMLRAASRRLEKRTGYGVGCWIDQPDEDHVAIVASSPGVFGFKPWIDRRRKLAAILMIEDVGRQRLGKGPPADLNSLVNAAVDAVSGRKRK